MGKEMGKDSLLDWLSDFLPEKVPDQQPQSPLSPSPPQVSASQTAPLASPPPVIPRFTSPPKAPAPAPPNPAQASSPPAQTPERPSSPTSDPIFIAPVPLHSASSPPAQTPEAPPEVGVTADLVSFADRPEIGSDRLFPSQALPPPAKTQASPAPAQPVLPPPATTQASPPPAQPVLPPSATTKASPSPLAPSTASPPNISPRLLEAVPLGQVSTPPISTSRASQITEEEANNVFIAYASKSLFEHLEELSNSKPSNKSVLFIDSKPRRDINDASNGVKKYLEQMKLFQHDFRDKKIVFIEQINGNHWEVFVKESGSDDAKNIKIKGDDRCGLTSAIVASSFLTDDSQKKNSLNNLLDRDPSSDHETSINKQKIAENQGLSNDPALNEKIKRLASKGGTANWLENDEILKIIQTQAINENECCFKEADFALIGFSEFEEKKIFSNALFSRIKSERENLNLFSCLGSDQIIEGKPKSAFSDFSSIFPSNKEERDSLLSDGAYVENIVEIVKKYLKDSRASRASREPNDEEKTREDNVFKFIQEALVSNISSKKKDELEESLINSTEGANDVLKKIDANREEYLKKIITRSDFISNAKDKINDQIRYLQSEETTHDKLDFEFLSFKSKQQEVDFFSDHECFKKWRRLIEVCALKLPEIKKSSDPQKKDLYNKLGERLSESFLRAENCSKDNPQIILSDIKRKLNKLGLKRNSSSLSYDECEDKEDKKLPGRELLKSLLKEIDDNADEFLKLQKAAFDQGENGNFQDKIKSLIEEVSKNDKFKILKVYLSTAEDADKAKRRDFKTLDRDLLLDIMTPDDFKCKPKENFRGWGRNIKITTDEAGNTKLQYENNREIKSIMVGEKDFLPELMGKADSHDLRVQEFVNFFRTKDETIKFIIKDGREETLGEKKLLRRDGDGFKNVDNNNERIDEESGDPSLLRQSISEKINTNASHDPQVSLPRRNVKSQIEMQKEAQKIMDHIKKRFDQLEVLLRDNMDENSGVRKMARAIQQNGLPADQDQQQPKTKTKLIIVIPGDENEKIDLGTRLAVGQWKEWAKQAGYQEKYGEIQHKKMIELIKQRVDRLKEIDKLHGSERAGHLQFGNVGLGDDTANFPKQFPIGEASLQDFMKIANVKEGEAKKKLGVAGAQGEVTNIENFNVIHVWGANADNWNKGDQETIGGGGQASAMVTQKEGVFGIVTTPMRGFENMEAKDCKTYGVAVSNLMAKPTNGADAVKAPAGAGRFGGGR